jgi:hypothetical protein
MVAIERARKLAEGATAKEVLGRGEKGQASDADKKREQASDADKKREATNTSSSPAESRVEDSFRINPNAVDLVDSKPSPAEVATEGKPSTKESRLPLVGAIVAGVVVLYFLLKE